MARFDMFKLNESTLSNKLQALPIEEIARQTHVENNYTKKVRARELLTSMLLFINSQETSLSSWASIHSLVSGESLSGQALARKFESRHLAFFQRVLSTILKQDHHGEPAVESALFESFNRVLVGDSTCVSVCPELAEAFPSSYAHGCTRATMRLQWLHDLKHESLVSYALQSYRDNDQKHAPAILEELQPGDLVLRDLGYFGGATFEAIDQRGAFFLSRLHYRCQVLDPDTLTPIDLVARMRKLKPGERLDVEVLLGAGRRQRVRLIAIALPPALVAQRQRQARQKAHKDKQRGCSEHYAQWLAWSFFVTNVPSERLSGEQLQQLYRLRWRIEMIFKGLKDIAAMERFLGMAGLNRTRLEIHLLGILLYAALVIFPYYRLLRKAWSGKGISLSLLKFMRWLKTNLLSLLAMPSIAEHAGVIVYQCRYEKRRTRLNYAQLCANSCQ